MSDRIAEITARLEAGQVACFPREDIRYLLDEVKRLRERDREECCEDFKAWQNEQIDARDKRIAELEANLTTTPSELLAECRATMTAQAERIADLEAQAAKDRRLIAAYRALRQSDGSECTYSADVFMRAKEVLAQLDPMNDVNALKYTEWVRETDKLLAIARGEETE